MDYIVTTLAMDKRRKEDEEDVKVGRKGCLVKVSKDQLTFLA